MEQSGFVADVGAGRRELPPSREAAATSSTVPGWIHASPPGCPAPRRHFEPAGDHFEENTFQHDVPRSSTMSLPAPTACHAESLPWQPTPCPRQAVVDPRTTVMLQLIAFRHTEETVAVALVQGGLIGTFDMIYIPRKRKTMMNFGYAFVNFTRPEFVLECVRAFHGKPLGCGVPTDRVCRVDYSRSQGAEFLRHCLASEFKRRSPSPADSSRPM